MRFLSEVKYRARAFFARRSMDAELAEELRDHIERETEANVRRGMPEHEARRAAAVTFGGITQFTEAARAARGWRWLNDLRLDVRHGFRLMRRNPAFAVATILLTALGIGTTTVIFSAVNGVLIRPLPFPNAERVARLLLRFPEEGRFAGDGLDSYALLSRDNPVLDGVGAFTVGSAVVSTAGEPDNARVEYVTPSLLRLLRVRPLLGRLLVDDDAEHAVAVVLLSHATWRRRFGGDSGVVGGTMSLDGISHTIVGVMPPEFTGPFLDERDLWLPVRVSGGAVEIAGRRRGATMVVRLEDGESRESAEAWLNSVMHRRVAGPTGGDTVAARVTLIPVLEQITGNVRKPLLILLGAVGFVLILAATNVATLVLARALARDREMAVRGALGASRTRQARQLVTETVLLTGLGGALGIGLAWLSLVMLTRQGVDVLPRLADISIDWRVAFCATALTFATGAIAGLIPALRAPGTRLSESIKGASTGSTSGSRGGGVRVALVIAEVAISVVLVVGAGLLVKGFLRVVPTAPGYAVERRAVVQVTVRDVPGGGRRAAEDYLRFMRDVRRRMEGVEGVREVAVTPFAPLVRSTVMVPMTVDPDGGEQPTKNGHLRMITPNFFAVMEIPLVAGRAFSERDDHAGALVAIVNQTAAGRWWPGEPAIGRRLRYTLTGYEPATVEIVGVARDTRFDGSFTSGRPEVFLPFDQRPIQFMTFIAHTAGEPNRLVDELKRKVWEVDPELPISYTGTLDDIAGDSVREQRFYVTLLAAFAAIAVLLASAGIFSVMAYAVSQRTREIGIRMALGAPRWSVGRLVLRQGVIIAVSGLLIGVLAARVLTRFLESLLLEITPTDPGVFASSVVSMCLVSLAACVIPLRRALTVDPARSLKAE